MENNNSKKTFPLFTVIIPVKNRAEYLYHTLRTCMIQTYPNLEIIICDDGSTDNSKDVIEEVRKNDSRIIYYSHNSSIGMRDNFEFALKQVKPGYVIALGGDDGLLPDGIMKMYEVLKDTRVKLLTWMPPVFTYPNVIGKNGQLVLNHRIKKGVKMINSKEFLNRQSKELSYINDIECPMFYVKGVVDTELIKKVCSRSKDGRFYSCPTPDGYSGIVLAGEVEKFAFSGEPFSIFGVSSSSQGMAYLSNDEKAKKESENFFRNVAGKPMHKELASQPYSPLITLMTVDYLLTARDLPGWSGKFQTIDFKKVLLNSINELSLGQYAEDRIIRELRILKKIADHHNLSEFFMTKLKKTKRLKKVNYFDGSGISPRVLFFDGENFNLNNILDAAYTAKTIFNINSALNIKFIFNILYRSFSYNLIRKSKGEKFPPEKEWCY